ncbi:hypothetical protein B0A68_02445 [Flavobacterium reichenbachii]|uniref:Uncharacterized protein n=1 Tax=Flavobacterium reichenbachii TaxID=362418 RepID=A0A085ZM17_9FLAO|nr:hypothetical protein IW19_08105 [Flavobacterium reichenbachii]OXB17821.1 hypothetical protein B0A68_02445 [Flavobacterium reichenbachii]
MKNIFFMAGFNFGCRKTNILLLKSVHNLGSKNRIFYGFGKNNILIKKSDLYNKSDFRCGIIFL